MELTGHYTTKMETEVEDLGFKATIAYLRHIGYDIIEQETLTSAGAIDLVARNDAGALTFITLYASCHRMPDVRTIGDRSRRDLECRAMAYIDAHRDEVQNTCVTFDVVYVGLIGSDRAMIRHHRNVLAKPVDDDGLIRDENGGLSLEEFLKIEDDLAKDEPPFDEE